MASNLEQSAGDLFGAGELPAERRFFSLAPGGMGTGMTIGDKYNHLLRLQKERADVLSNMAGAQRSEVDLMNTTQDIINIRNRHNVLDELDKLSFRDDELPEKLSQFDRAQLMDPIVAKKVSNLANRNSNYQQGRTQIVQSLYDAGYTGREFNAEYAAATDMLNSYDAPGLSSFFARANRRKAGIAAERDYKKFTMQETFKHKLSTHTNLDSAYKAHVNAVRAITKDAVPSYFVENYRDQFVYGLPFGEEDYEHSVIVEDEDGTIKGDRGGNAKIKKVTVKRDLSEGLIEEHIERAFDSYTNQLKALNIKKGKRTEKGTPVFTVRGSGIEALTEGEQQEWRKELEEAKETWKKNNKGVSMPPEVIKEREGDYVKSKTVDPEIPIDSNVLKGLRLPKNTLDSEDNPINLVTYFKEGAEGKDLKAFIEWGLNTDTGFKKTLAEFAAAAQGEDDQMYYELMSDLAENVHETDDPASAFLGDIWKFIEAIKQLKTVTSQNLGGPAGGILEKDIILRRMDRRSDKRAPMQAGLDNVAGQVMSASSLVEQ